MLGNTLVKLVGLLSPDDVKELKAAGGVDEGLKRLYREAGGEERELEPWGLQECARKKWSLPFIYVEPERWDKLGSKEEVKGE